MTSDVPTPNNFKTIPVTACATLTHVQKANQSEKFRNPFHEISINQQTHPAVYFPNIQNRRFGSVQN